MISSAARLGRFLRTSWDGPHSSAGPKLALLHPRNHAVSFGALSSRARRARTVEPETRDKDRSEQHTSELQSLMRISYAVFCVKTQNNNSQHHTPHPPAPTPQPPHTQTPHPTPPPPHTPPQHPP